MIGFYGPPVGTHRSGLPAPIDQVGQVTCAVLGLFGGADPGLPGETVDAYGDALAAAGVEHRMVVYPGAPHSFFDRSAAEHADAAASAWREALTFMVVSVP